MKKIIALLLLVSCMVTLSACNNAKQEKTRVYSFTGENEEYVITNGVVVLTDEEDVFYGGELKAIQPDGIKNIASYRAEFYTRIGDEEDVILVSAMDNDSSSEMLNVDFGMASGNGKMLDDNFSNMDESQGDFWCELRIKDTQGNQNSYIIDLTLTEITSENK